MYIVEYASGIKKDFKKIDRRGLLFVKQRVISRISYDPYQEELLHGDFKKYKKCAFSFGGVAYRIAYKIKHDKTMVLLILVSTRENFYKELKRRIH